MDLNENEIIEVPFWLINLIDLEILRIDKNPLKDISQILITRLASLTQISLPINLKNQLVAEGYSDPFEIKTSTFDCRRFFTCCFLILFILFIYFFANNSPQQNNIGYYTPQPDIFQLLSIPSNIENLILNLLMGLQITFILYWLLTIPSKIKYKIFIHTEKKRVRNNPALDSIDKQLLNQLEDTLNTVIPCYPFHHHFKTKLLV